jgi:sugar phosphate isomerase/epimerase
MELTPELAEAWRTALAAEGFELTTVFCAYNGESYKDVPTVAATVGFIPPATRQEREDRTLAVSDLAAAIGVKSIACHVGFVPEPLEGQDNSEYCAVRNLVRRICDHASQHGQTFALETGQEPAPVLLKFLKDVERPNIGINFDPANMVLYGTGDPIEALSVLSPQVISVHCKDGQWPPKDAPNALGRETTLGLGAVNMELFIAKLKQVGYHGPLMIEREDPDPEQRRHDIIYGIELLRRLTA